MKYTWILGMLLLFTACSEKVVEDIDEIKPYKTGDIITLKGVEGGQKKLKRLSKGFELVGDEKKILIFDFFGTFCPPCQKEAPSLTKLQIDYSSELVLIGLTTFEEVSDKYVVENFSQKYGAHYFIANSKDNERIAQSILEDISYPTQMQLPFKVVLKNAQYQNLTDVWEGKEGIKYYLGDVGVKTIREDLEKIKEK